MVTYDLENTPIVDLVNKIIVAAVKARASDIHLDPIENGLKVRIRIDGVLRDHTVIPKEYERNLTTRVKLISNMNITETRLPQDGAIKGRIDGIDLDMRVSVLPTNEGEKVVIRILDYKRSLAGINSLGFSHKNYKKVEKMIQVPNGIILVTGATGSGKSTTTYSILQDLNKEGTNIITVEDPIEMNIEGVNQVQVNSDIGLTFAHVLRSILRQDPNIILIGEIRDSETAKIAVRASITGHLVLSTVHTNNSLSTIERLLDMDVERYLLSSALTGIISQKLARTLCPDCKRLRRTTIFEKHVFKEVLNKDVVEVYEPVGCPHCTNGYRGRHAIQEVLLINDEIQDAISNENIRKEELKELVYKADVITLLQDGLEKVLEGFTTFEEIYKLIEIEDGLDNQYGDILTKTKDNKEIELPVTE
ncbi:MAG: GspE/PulE family protein [Bacilli bacterium]